MQIHPALAVMVDHVYGQDECSLCINSHGKYDISRNLKSTLPIQSSTRKCRLNPSFFPSARSVASAHKAPPHDWPCSAMPPFPYSASLALPGSTGREDERGSLTASNQMPGILGADGQSSSASTAAGRRGLEAVIVASVVKRFRLI